MTTSGMFRLGDAIVEVTKSDPDSRFTENSEFVVHDTKTDIVWTAKGSMLLNEYIPVSEDAIDIMQEIKS